MENNGKVTTYNPDQIDEWLQAPEEDYERSRWVSCNQYSYYQKRNRSSYGQSRKKYGYSGNPFLSKECQEASQKTLAECRELLEKEKQTKQIQINQTKHTKQSQKTEPASNHHINEVIENNGSKNKDEMDDDDKKEEEEDIVIDDVMDDEKSMDIPLKGTENNEIRGKYKKDAYGKFIDVTKEKQTQKTEQPQKIEPAESPESVSNDDINKVIENNGFKNKEETDDDDKKEDEEDIVIDDVMDDEKSMDIPLKITKNYEIRGKYQKDGKFVDVAKESQFVTEVFNDKNQDLLSSHILLRVQENEEYREQMDDKKEHQFIENSDSVIHDNRERMQRKIKFYYDRQSHIQPQYRWLPVGQSVEC